MSSLSHAVAERLTQAAGTLGKTKVLVGFDGFVDTILHVVAQRESVTKFTRMEQMSEFSARIGAAAGLSANFEFVTQMVKLGGNGPIMAHALGSYGLPTTYIGNLGAPNVHAVFSEFAQSARVISIAEPGYTDAIEFEDGKLMCGKHESLRDVNWKTLIKHTPEEELTAIFQESGLISMVNWTMLTQLGEIWEKVAARIAPKLTGEKRWLFFDLADPAKRSREDLAAALRQISGFEKWFRVILGLNLQESRQVGEVLEIGAPEETYGTVTHHAAKLRDALQIDTVVVHPNQFAAAADSSGSSHVVGPFTAKPKITTGAGDHFNAGFCVGRVLGCDLEESLQLGVATSGYYVRNARTPDVADLCKFLREL
jgi:hypothetical protein